MHIAHSTMTIMLLFRSTLKRASSNASRVALKAISWSPLKCAYSIQMMCRKHGISVAKKIGFKPAPRSRGKKTHEHFYRDENGNAVYKVLRYPDGSASYSRYAGFGYSGPMYRAGLGGRKRTLYNLPEVIAAEVVLFVEGEKKADILKDLKLRNPMAIPWRSPQQAALTRGVSSTLNI